MKLFAFLFSGIGLLLLSISGYLFIREQQFLNQAQTTAGKVIELRRSVDSKGGVIYYPVISYTTPDGKAHIFDSSYGSNPASYEAGEAVEVFYQPNKPASAEIKGFFSQWLTVLITGFLGTVFGSIGGGITISLMRASKKQKQLIMYGKKIRSKVIAIVKDIFLRENGRTPYVIHAQWLNAHTNQMHIFKSDSIWYDPTEYVPEYIDVMVDLDDPEKYQMDLSCLPALANA